MAQHKLQRRGRTQKRSRARFENAKAQISSRQDEPVAEDAQSDYDSESSGSEIENEKTERPYSTILEIFRIDPGRQPRARKRRKISSNDAPTVNKGSDIDDAFDDAASFSVGESGGQHVETGEEVETEEVEEAGADLEDDDLVDAHGDPFLTRIDAPDQSAIGARVQVLGDSGWQTSRYNIDGIGSCMLSSPKAIAFESPPEKASRDFMTGPGIKLKLREAAQKLEKQCPKTIKAWAPYILNYADVLHGARTPSNAPYLQQITCLHVLNHIYKTRDRVLKHNTKLAAAKENPDIIFRDQGFTRPKVLFLLPTRGACVKVVNTLVKLAAAEQQENKKRFEDNFEAENDETFADRPEDFKDLFDGNNDDMFRIGIKFTRKTMKFFAPFYNSDIILASPLGLRNAIEGSQGKKPDFDFLSSIEIMVIDQADALLMQNWEHVTFIMQHLNLSPKEAHGCDFSRVRMWYLDDHAKYLRQSICLSSFITPEINALFSKYMLNIFGKIKYQALSDGSTLTTGLPIKQTFTRYASPSVQTDPDARFTFFTSTIIPWLLRQPRPADGGLGALIFVPSYFDFVRVKNYFTTSTTVTSLSFATVTENHTPAEPETRRARSHFLTGKSSVLIYTGRAHHFYRYMIKGVKHVIMYQLPDNPIFYREIVAGFLGASVMTGRIAAEEGSVRVLFSKYDALRLECVVGTERLPTMMGAGDTFEFI